jgi:hypothetical protein
LGKNILQVLIPLILISHGALAATDAELPFYQSASIDGPTGLLSIPTARVLDNGYYTLATHKYLFKANFGLFSVAEIGARIDAEQFTVDKDAHRRFTLHGKYNFLDGQKYPVAASVGFYYRDVYLSVDKSWPSFYNLFMTAGVKLRDDGRWRALFGVSKIINTSQFIFDKEGGSYNLGYRILLTPKIKLDFGLINLQDIEHFGFDNLTFGLNFSEPLFPADKKKKWYQD